MRFRHKNILVRILHDSVFCRLAIGQNFLIVVIALSREQENQRVWKVKELVYFFTDMCLVVLESDKEGDKTSSKPSSAVLPHKKTKKSSLPTADPAGMQNYVFKRGRGQIQI